MGITCVCLTYGRVSFLEESLFSFLRQNDTSDSEMLIVNDCPFQNLEFDDPRVRIMNITTNFNTMGDKINYAIEEASNDIIVIWDDDDIALPNHLKNIKNNFNGGLMMWNNVFRYDGAGNINIIDGRNCAFVFDKQEWKNCGGYSRIDEGFDSDFTNKLSHITYSINLTPENISWLYMWAERPTHISQNSNFTIRSMMEDYRKYILLLKDSGRIPEGNITLFPRWKKNYLGLIKNAILNNTSG